MSYRKQETLNFDPIKIPFFMFQIYYLIQMCAKIHFYDKYTTCLGINYDIL